MSQYLVERIKNLSNVEVVIGCEVGELHGRPGQLEGITIRQRATGTDRQLPARFLFSFIGAEPNTDWLQSSGIRLDERGFVLTGPDLMVDTQRPRGWSLDRDPYYLEASVPGVYAAGDVRANSVKRVASAVGEGAMAIQLIHGYLEHQ
jgi:thioredoxin reductase (NADPH)